MEQDWTTVRGKKLNQKVTKSPHRDLKSLETTILVNINNIIESEFQRIPDFDSNMYYQEANKNHNNNNNNLVISWNKV